MKLHELGARRPQEQVAKVIETHLGDRIDFDRISPRDAQRLLQKVRHLVREHRAGPNRHYGERNPDYLRLVMLEQALKSRVSEAQIVPGGTTAGQMASVMADPKSTAVMQKVQRGQALTTDEQRTMNKLALAKEAQVTEKYMGFEKTAKAVKKGGSARDPEAVAAAIGRKKYGKERFQKAAAAGRKLGESRLTEANELQQAQVVLAAQDMIDRVQGMLEDVSEMQFKDLPALADSIKNDMGMEQATQFQQQASAALTTLLQAMQAGKTELESAQGVLTGQAPVIPGAETDMAAVPAAGEEEIDLSLDANLPDGEEEEEVATASLGRERR
jgi:hypothetical protein